MSWRLGGSPGRKRSRRRGRGRSPPGFVWIEREHGRGSFVKARPSAELDDRPRQGLAVLDRQESADSVRLVEAGRRSAPGWVAGRLGLSENAPAVLRRYLIPALGRKKLSKLTVLDVDRLWQAKRNAGYKPNSIRIMRTVLRRALAQAEREGIITRNVAALSAAPHVVAKEGRTLTLDQARALLEAVAGHRFEVAIMMALAYGLRRGEVLGLHWAGIDWDAGTIRVTHSVKRIKNRDKSSTRKTRIVISELKTPKSRRTLVLTPQILDKLRKLHAQQARTKLAAGDLWQEHGLIFTTEVGTPVDPDNFSHTFSKLAKLAGIGHWHPHELRHSGASLMLAQGTPLHVVSEVLGHASIAITKDVYGHVLVDDRRAAAEAMSGALFGP